MNRQLVEDLYKVLLMGAAQRRATLSDGDLNAALESAKRAAEKFEAGTDSPES